MAEVKELTREEKLDIEDKALQTLLNYGLRFSVPLKITPKTSSWYIKAWNRIFKKHPIIYRDKRLNKEWDVDIQDIMDINHGAESSSLKRQYVRVFYIKPLYLGTIDYIRKLAIEIEYNEGSLQDNPVEESERLMKYTSLMSKIAAVAILNKSSIVEARDKEVNQLSRFLLDHLTSTRLLTLFQAINQMSNKVGFINSIRSIQQVDTTTIPKASRVE